MDHVQCTEPSVATCQELIFATDWTMEEGRLESVHFFLNGNDVGSIPVFLFSKASRKYERICRQIEGRAVLASPVEAKSVGEFIECCMKKPLNVDEGNVLDLLALCEEWEVHRRIKKPVRAFFESTTPNTVLRLYATSVEKGLEIGKFLEEKIHGCMLSLCEQRSYKELQDLGIQALLRIFDMKDRSLVREHVHEVFDFVMSCFRNEKIGSLASALFLGITFSELSPEERIRLLAEERMDFQVLNREEAVASLDVKSVVSRNQVLVQDQITQLSDTLKVALERLDQLQERNQVLERQVAEMARVKVECTCHDDMGLQVSCKTCNRTMQFHPDRQVEENVFPESLGQFNGIMNWLQLRFRKAFEKMVIVSESSRALFGNPPASVLSYYSKSHWSSDNKPNSYIQFQFLNQRVRITAYTIMGDGKWNCYLRSWELAVSNDADTWTIIDVRDTEELMKPNSVMTYQCNKDDQYYRYVRLTQTGPNAAGNNYLVLCQFEIFGALEPVDKSAICVNPVCSYALHGEEMIVQKFFGCRTCGLTEDRSSEERWLGCCEACAYSCHRGHDIWFIGWQKGFCDCETCAPTPCQCFPRHGCTYLVTGETPMRQQMFLCHTCGLSREDEPVCAQCAMECHFSHNLESVGLIRGWCHCHKPSRFLNKHHNCSLLQGEDASAATLLP